ncbi:GNAT family N-acetyltransferase [Spirochaeta cellobiosiphila]|uniref:GNAT family N-acetyltransferase n=1 Tax=Spirochaeta cellobiosiphila TaxID=504483 RepID=UPI000404EF27|nr:GNAT family protein [Spirochaeta cellobiosiphila]
MSENKTIYDQKLSKIKSLDTQRLTLRWFELSDIKDVFEYASHEEVVTYLTWPPHSDIEYTKKRFPDLFLHKPGMFAIELKLQKKCIGCIELRIDAPNDKGSFGYVLNQNYWNKGYMTEALARIIDASFTDLELNRVEAIHYVGNEKSGKVMKKVGMKKEGVALKEVKIKGEYRDVVHFGLLKEHWIKL